MLQLFSLAQIFPPAVNKAFEVSVAIRGSVLSTEKAKFRAATSNNKDFSAAILQLESRTGFVTRNGLYWTSYDDHASMFNLLLNVA